MPNKTVILATGLSGMIGDRFQQQYAHKFDFENLDLTTNIDITDKKQVDQSVKNSHSEIILHLAAFTDTQKAAKQDNDTQGLCYQINVVGTQNIVEAAKKYHKYLIHISTDFVFDGRKNKPLNESEQTNPIEWYGKTKLMAEEYVTKNLDHYSILRPSFPYRSHYQPKLDIIRKIIKGLKQDNLPSMFTDHYITPTFIDDLCKVFFMFTLKRPKGIYHAGGSSFITDYDLAVLVKKTFDLPGKITPGSLDEYLKTAPRPYQKYLKLSNDKLQLELGNPMLTIEAAMQIIKSQM
jgi:dTDP-4-dehydrorhamnose reductase